MVILEMHQIAPSKNLFRGSMPPNLPIKVRRALHPANGMYITPQYYHTCLNMDLRS